jgi:hypothetical protein
MLRTAVVALGLLARAADGGVISASSLEMCEKREDGSGNVDSTVWAAPATADYYGHNYV